MENRSAGAAAGGGAAAAGTELGGAGVGACMSPNRSTVAGAAEGAAGALSKSPKPSSSWTDGAVAVVTGA
eukprot:scaffold1236_cov503-Prasinococcus_capsulatus_cf.AAC.10